MTKAPAKAAFRYHLGWLIREGRQDARLKELQDALKYNPTKPDREKIQALIARLG